MATISLSEVQRNALDTYNVACQNLAVAARALKDAQKLHYDAHRAAVKAVIQARAQGVA